WNIDYILRLITGIRGLALADYMFDSRRLLYVRLLSLFHIPLPILLIWMIARLGYDPRALVAQTLLAWIVLPLTYWLTPPALNINWVFGWGTKPQKIIPPLLYLAPLMILFPLAVYLPTHLIHMKCV